jgi:hypothetical protein
MESRIKSYIKKKDKNKPKEKESYKLLRVTQNLKQKKEKDKNKEIEKDKKEETFKVKRNLKYNKSMAGILSDSETIKTETTRGDTLTENNKNRYIYRKSVNKKNFSFAIKNFFQKIQKRVAKKKTD